MWQWVVDEIVLPDGPFEGHRYRYDRQPYASLLFEAIDNMERWGMNRCCITGNSQSGKSLHGWVIPAAYHLFEIGETIICGLPDMNMAADKWREDLLPVIERTRYRELLPRTGPGSRGGGTPIAIKFRNGATLRFMTGGGDDKTVSAYTARVVVITETDGMDESGGTSREADRITQLENRTTSFSDRKRVYMECTLSTSEGRTWREFNAGTATEIVMPCPHCGHYVRPEREHFIGWAQAPSIVEARALAAFHCPKCAAAWTPQERRTAVLASAMLHRGQTIDRAGRVKGATPATDTLGFRWSGVHNLLMEPTAIAAREWRASHDPDEENAEKEMKQFIWAEPYDPPKLDTTPLVPDAIQKRTIKTPRGVVPDGAATLTVGVDLGKYLGHWCAIAWWPNYRGHVVDYGVFEIKSDELGLERALLLGLSECRDMLFAGWGRQGGGVRIPDQAWIDAGYQRDIVYQFCRDALAADPEPKRRTNMLRFARLRPALGLGVGQHHQRRYHKPGKVNDRIRHIGEEYHVAHVAEARAFVVEVNADYWKAFVHERLGEPDESESALTLFEAMPNEHQAISRHLTAEKQTEEFVPGKGMVVKWERIRRANHWFDCVYNAAAAAHLAGARVVGPQIATEPDAKRRTPRASARFKTPSGRPFVRRK